MDPRRWTPLTVLAPGRYVDRDPAWAEFDLEGWARDEYEWTEDRWNGLLDLARRPRETLAAGEGDCEDFALVALSWALANGRPGVGFGVCFRRPSPVPAHAIAFDDERVYSSGDVVRTSVEAWLDDSEYDYVLRRGVA